MTHSIARLFRFVKEESLKELPVHTKNELTANVKRNIPFLISAFSFFGLYISLSLARLVSFVIAILLLTVIASQSESFVAFSKSKHIALKCASLLSALGVCWYAAIRLNHTFDISILVVILGALAAVYFVYTGILFVLDRLVTGFKKDKLFDNVKRYEIILYSVLIIGALIFSSVAFAKSQVFWGTEYYFDFVYTSDSMDLIKGNAFINLFHPENDLRQPLFAVFSAPFMGITFLISRLFGVSNCVQAIIMNSVQVILLIFSTFLLAKMMDLSPVKRICFMLISCSTYTFLLFSLMMEQYIVAFFWLTLGLYKICTRGKMDRLAFYGATGTLLTSAILIPFVSDRSPIKDFKNWICDLIKECIGFVVLMLTFCRFDIFYYLTSKVSQLSGYTGHNVSFADKLYQYSAFIRDCFIAPKAGITTTAEGHITWQMCSPDGISIIGVSILIVAIISLILNRKKISSLLAGGWIGFSIILLLILGWGTNENGLILYALYFGWAFLVLLFQLVDKIGERLNVKFLVPAVSVCSVILLAAFNIPAISDLLRFAISYYPV